MMMTRIGLICGRSDPQLPLALLRARGRLVELRAPDLRFTPEEASALLLEAWRLDLTPESAAVLAAMCCRRRTSTAAAAC